MGGKAAAEGGAAAALPQGVGLQHFAGQVEAAADQHARGRAGQAGQRFGQGGAGVGLSPGQAGVQAAGPVLENFQCTFKNFLTCFHVAVDGASGGGEPPPLHRDSSRFSVRLDRVLVTYPDRYVQGIPSGSRQ